MNTPTHIAAGVFVSRVVLRRFAGASGVRLAWVGVGCFLAGLASHLLLDLLPHYAWIVYLPGFEGLPFHWLIREATVALAVALPLVYCTRDHWGCAVLGMLGALYPDIEKVMYIDIGMPDWMVLFRWHSMELSNHDGGMPLWGLVVIELAVLTGLIVGTLKLAPEGGAQRARQATRPRNAAP